MGDINIDKLSVFSNGIVIETRSSTSDCNKVLEDVLEFAEETLGAQIRPSRRNYISQIVFSSELRLPELNPVLARVSNAIQSRVRADMRHPFVFETTGITIGLILLR